MRILVTGLAGFTGHYVKNELEMHSHEVFGLKSDLTDSSAVFTEVKQIQPNAVIHLAATAFVGHSNIADFYRVNLIGTCNLLEAIAQAAPNIQSILLVSSANIYGNQSANALSEDALPNPANDYAVSKLAMEKMANLWINRLPLFFVRPFNYTGIGQSNRFLIPKIVAHFQKKANTIELGNLDVYREFNDVRMIAEIYRKLLHITPVGEAFNVCTGKAYSLKNIITLCENITGHTMETKVNPKFVRENEVKSLTGSNTKLTNLMGDYDWKKQNLEQTLKWMLK